MELIICNSCVTLEAGSALRCMSRESSFAEEVVM